MPEGWVDDRIEAYRLTGAIVLNFLRDQFPQGQESDFDVKVRRNLVMLRPPKLMTPP